MSWRYQPVTQTHEDVTIVSLCECYFDEDGKLRSWSEPGMEPAGNDIEDLSGVLANMLAATWKWIAVDYEDLKVGMTFERTGIDVEKMIAAMDLARRPS